MRVQDLPQVPERSDSGAPAEPPSPNRGVLSTSDGWYFGLDWLQATAFSNEQSATLVGLRDGLDRLLGGLGGFEPDLHGRRGYAVAEAGVAGSWLAHHPMRPEQGVHYCLPARALANVQGDDPLRALRFAFAGGHRLSRLDVALDVPAALLTPTMMKAWAQAGMLVTRAVQTDWREKGDLRRHETWAPTFYVGSPKSERMLRVYDKQAESGEGVPRTRIELQLRDESAQAMGYALLAADNPRDAFLDALVGFVDVRDLDNPEPERRTRTAEWAEVVREARTAPMRKPRRRPSLEANRKWLRSCVAPSLAVALEAAGGDLGFLRELAAEGRERWGPRHRHMVLEAAAA